MVYKAVRSYMVGDSFWWGGGAGTGRYVDDDRVLGDSLA